MATTTTAVQEREHTNLERAMSKGFARDLTRFLGTEEATAALIAEIFNQARRVPQLHHCTIESIRLNIARIAALRLNPALPNMVAFIPRNLEQPKAREGDKPTYAVELTVQYGYAALRELVMRSPEVKDCFTKEVCVNDFFEPPPDITMAPTHRLPERFHPRGRVEGYYSVIELHNGNWRYWPMSVADVEAHVKRYIAKPGPAWDKGGRRPDVEDGLTSFDKMALKTCLRMQCNGRDVPMTVEVATALRQEQEVLDATAHTMAEYQGYDRQGNRPALTTGSGLSMDDLMQDLGGAQDKEAVHVRVTQETRRQSQRAEPPEEGPQRSRGATQASKAIETDPETGEVVPTAADTTGGGGDGEPTLWEREDAEAKAAAEQAKG